jgi:protein involved in polysaccharide export with SLBB domain
MRRRVVRALAGLSLLVVGIVARAAETPASTAEIRIGLPEGGAPTVALSPDGEGIRIDLPHGSEFPDDFVESSGGLLARGRAVSNGDRVELDLEFGPARLERFTVEPEAVVLRLVSRLPTQDEAFEPAERYLIGPGDKLLVTVYGQPDLTGSVVVNRAGYITAPLVRDVQAQGLTTQQLAARLGEGLEQFLVGPEVDVEVEEYRSQWVVIDGEVGKKGRIPLRGGTTLKEVLGEAEGFLEKAGETITITRGTAAGGQPEVVRVDRRAFERGEVNPLLSHGDIVNVPMADYCYVSGELRQTGRFSLERGMTLMRVLSMAGLSEWSNRKEVTVITEIDGQRVERVYNLNKIEKGRVPDPPIETGAVILVKRRFL